MIRSEGTPAGGAGSPPDRCPYSGPLASGWCRCPAYQPVTFLPLDSMNRPLQEAMTCGHLAVGSDQERAGRFYPRCALGSHAKRLQWVLELGEARLAAIRTLQADFDAFSRPYRRRMAEARAKMHLESLNGRRTASLDRELRDYLTAATEFVSLRSDVFEAAGFEVESLLALVRSWWETWSAAPGASAGSTEALAVFDRAGQLTLAAAAPVADADELVYADGQIQVVRRPSPPGLAVAGELDANNVDAFAAALAAHVDGAPEFHVDLAGVEFADLGALTAIVDAARRLRNGQRLVVHGTPSHLREAMELVGWNQDEVPWLVIRERAS